VTVQCPRCETQYRVPDEKLSHRRPTFKCTRCGHLFPAERSAAAARAREPEKNLSFTFDAPREAGNATRAARGREDEIQTGPTAPGALDLAEPAFVAAAARDRRADDKPAPQQGASASGRGEGISPPAPDADPDEEDEPGEATSVWTGAAPEKKMPIRPRTVLAAPRPRRSPVRAVGIGVLLTLLAYLSLAVYLNRRPDLTLDTLAQVPLLGRLIGDDNLLAWRLELVDVEGGLEQIKGRRPAYIVSGRAVNTTGEPLRIIEVEGRLVAGGTVRQRRRAYAANQFKKTVRELSASEVEMLLRLEPNRRFVVQPGESANFLIVFPDPPADVTGVECRVVEARTA
jgi:predicted Zn finger-like uncharacterized protein